MWYLSYEYEINKVEERSDLIKEVVHISVFPLMQAPSRVLVTFKAPHLLPRFSYSSLSPNSFPIFSSPRSYTNMAGLNLKVPVLKMSDGNAIPMVGLILHCNPQLASYFTYIHVLGFDSLVPMSMINDHSARIRHRHSLV
jgi:hypothetical protein